MNVVSFHCGPFANESERKAFEYLDSRLRSAPGNDEWILLTNLTFSVTHQLQADEIDLIVIGPPGVCVIEIKHWASSWLDGHKNQVETEADRLTNKARKIGTTLRRNIPDLPFVLGAFLVTQEASRVKNVQGKKIRGVPFHRLNDWRSLVGLDGPIVLTSKQIRQASAVLEPRIPVAVDGSLRRLAGYNNMELKTPVNERFHRAYKAEHPSRRDRVVMHTYDLSASNDKNAEVKASREFDALHYLQIFPWAPRILDSYQEAPGYSGEMYFFTLIDPVAPPIEERSQDETWTSISRVSFARNSVKALAELHSSAVEDEPIIHRNITPKTILCRHDDSPILTSFEYARIPSDISLGSNTIQFGTDEPFISPEVRSQNLGAADHRSDIYSLCSSVSQIFLDREDEASEAAKTALLLGTHEDPGERCTLEDLDSTLSEILGESIPSPTAPPSRYWTEGQIIRSGNGMYRIVSLLGSGGMGRTFKVVQIDGSTNEDLGTFVAKAAHEAATEATVRAYNLARSHLPSNESLSNIFEVGRPSEPTGFSALMTWVPGTPLMDFAGVFQLLAQDDLESGPEALSLRWLTLILGALEVLHQNGLIHGDVSPKNLIVSGSNLVLTDYDFVRKIGEPIESTGTIIYCSPSQVETQFAYTSGDIYALAASFFHVVFDKEPFLYGGNRDKPRGLNWEGLTREDYPILAAFLDKATHAESGARFSNVAEAKEFIEAKWLEDGETKTATDNLGIRESDSGETKQGTNIELGEQRIDWLLSLLQAYPGSSWGNSETRGLDTDFAAETYVESGLETSLFQQIMERKIRLVILCGNAGDGKTALLQRLADALGIGQHQSSERIIEGQIADGPYVRINMDGSASWESKSADEILDEFIEPFLDGAPSGDIVNMVAINDGRLLEWLEGFETRQEDRQVGPNLITELYELLDGQQANPDSYIRFVNLNQRSLVGGFSRDNTRIETSFLQRLIDQLYGGEQAGEKWRNCQSCSAKNRCQVYRSARIFGPDSLPDLAEPALRSHARNRLFETLQAVHLRGETHITIRELRSSLIYILFGVQFCDYYHNETAIVAVPYWERAFSSESPRRQGEVLSELALFDPGLESHPHIDRYLGSKLGDDVEKVFGNYSDIPLESARRRAYFEWSIDHIEEISGSKNSLGLARGQHLETFRDLPILENVQDLNDITKQICNGIARLEDLPPQALDRPDVVPLRVTPRTPTETAFWVEKPSTSFRLEVNLSSAEEGFEQLHRQAELIYTYQDGTEEKLFLGAELFHLLLELSEGYQLGDISTDDTFAHLSIFVQRLVKEDEKRLLAWNPMRDTGIYQVSSMKAKEIDEMQSMVISLIDEGVEK